MQKSTTKESTFLTPAGTSERNEILVKVQGGEMSFSKQKLRFKEVKCLFPN